MARVNVEQKALTDSRFKVLGKLIGADEWAALGRMVAVWNECQERGKTVLTDEQLTLLHPDIELFAEKVLKSGLGKRRRRGIYITGARGRVEWLERKREIGRLNGKKGGRPKKTDVGSGKNQRRLRTENPSCSCSCSCSCTPPTPSCA
jgi:hypothetical protein